MGSDDISFELNYEWEVSEMRLGGTVSTKDGDNN